MHLLGDSRSPLVGVSIPKAQRERTESDPDREAFMFFNTGYRTTFAEFEQTTNNIAANFLASGQS